MSALPIALPWLGEEEAAAAREAILSGWVTQGPRVVEFERAVAAYSAVPECVAVSNCTTALHLTLVALGIGPGDEVICPSMSFIATANSIRHAGATPVFADVDPRTFNLDPDAAAAMITTRTRAVMPVHQLGLPADLDRFVALADRHGLVVIEDAACAIGSRYRGRPVGGDGVAGCFSLHPRKVITTGEGGLITTRDPDLAARLRLLRQHGMSMTDSARHGAKTVVIESYLLTGYNFRLTDVQAAIGIVQMDRLPEIVRRRRELAAAYAARITDIPWLIPPFVPEYAEPNFQSYAVTLRPDAPVSRIDLMQGTLNLGIATRRGVMLAHREPAYEGPTYHLPASEAASDRSLILPLYPQMTEADVDQVCDALRAVGRRNRAA